VNYTSFDVKLSFRNSKLEIASTCELNLDYSIHRIDVITDTTIEQTHILISF